MDMDMILVINQTSKWWMSHTYTELALFGACLVVERDRLANGVARADSVPYKNFPVARLASVATQEDRILNEGSPAVGLEIAGLETARLEIARLETARSGIARLGIGGMGIVRMEARKLSGGGAALQSSMGQVEEQEEDTH
ncbi:hypothetical protein N7454_005718 [Penicillium verhagenii]|nr:hypothetical protein N7454_005718 [Penicillium verhagenii]